MNRKIHQAPIAVTTEGALVVNVSGFGEANIEGLIARALDADAEIFIGIVVSDSERDVLRWHVDTQLETPEQQGSDLLFPSITGGFRTMKVLNQPLAEVATELKLGKQITQRALRRTFNDLARAAQVNDLVTRSISGHLTEQMQRHYSTVNGAEQRDALAKVIRLADHFPEKSGEDGGEGNSRSGEDQKSG